MSKNLHLDHIEDYVLFSEEPSKILKILVGLEQFLSSGVCPKGLMLKEKVDGSPSITFGINPENNRFFVGTKGVFNKTPKLNYTKADIYSNHSNSTGLQAQLCAALKCLPKLKQKQILQADMLFVKGDVFEDKTRTYFKPNTLTYGVDKKSKVADMIRYADIGIAIHTAYKGAKTLDKMSCYFPQDISALIAKECPTVWIYGCDPVVPDTLLTEQERNYIFDKIEEIKAILNNKFDNTLLQNPKVVGLLKTYVNGKFRQKILMPESPAVFKDFVSYVNEQYETHQEELKTQLGVNNSKKEQKELVDFLTLNKGVVKQLFHIWHCVYNIKEIAIQRSYAFGKQVEVFFEKKLTDPEGYVLSHKDIGAVKLVDRYEFVAKNEKAEQSWKR